MSMQYYIYSEFLVIFNSKSGDIMDTIDKIFQILKEKKLTQKDFAKHLGVSISTISEWKSKRNDGWKSKIEDISKFLNVDVSYIYGEQRTDITDEDIKFALFGGEEGVSDEAYEEVKEFVKFVKQKYKNKW